MKNVNHTKKVNAKDVHESHLAKKNDLKIAKSPLLRFSVSLALSLFIVYTIFQVQTPVESQKVADAEPVLVDDTLYVPEFKVEKVVVKEPKQEPVMKPTIITDDLKVVEDDTTIKDQVLDTKTKPVEVTSFVNTDDVEVIDEDPEIEEVPFAFIEDAPVFPGCEKYKDKASQKKCMSEKIQSHVNRKFDTGLAGELNLDEGVKRINVLFVIDENGNITGIQSRGPHPKLEKEAARVIKLLPQMKPGKQRNVNVKVKYTLPIIFRVD